MTADEFVQRLAECAPSLADLVQIGLPAAQASRILASFIATRRTGIDAVDSDPLLDLVSRYDASKLTVGMIRFGSKVMKSYSGACVGKLEADPLMINVLTGEVCVEELGSEGHILHHCASDGDHFLDAVLASAHTLATCLWDFELSQNRVKLQEKARAAAATAGGDKFLTFYNTLLGAL